jgi:hypothetical protein
MPGERNSFPLPGIIGQLLKAILQGRTTQQIDIRIHYSGFRLIMLGQIVSQGTTGKRWDYIIADA